MRPRIFCPRRLHIQTQYQSSGQLPLRRQFRQHAHQLNGEVKYEPPTTEPPPEPKNSTSSLLKAVLIGGGISLALTAYRRRNTSTSTTEKVSDGFATFTLVDKEAVSSTCSIFTLKPLSARIKPGEKGFADGGIHSVQVKQPQLQIARSYTMLPPIAGEPTDTMRLLIRKEQKGEVSGYLHTLALGQDVEVRGPYNDYAFPPNTKEVIFLAGGTGIAPALKTADALAREADVHILWASRKSEDSSGGVSDTPMERGILSGLKSWFAGSAVQDTTAERNAVVLLLDLLKQQARVDGGSLKVDYFADEKDTRIRPGTVASLLKASRTDDGDKIIFVSGPEGFISYWAGPKVFVNGKEEQGNLGGALSRMNLQGWQVVKL